MTIRGLFWFWYATGLVLMLTVGVPGWLSFSNGLFLLFYAVYALDIERGIGERRAVRLGRAAIIGLVTFLIEYIGVTTGWPFGEYAYTSVLGFGIGGVPLAIACAWVGVMLNIILLFRHVSRWRRALLVGCWTIVFDLVLDPVAYARGFWLWDHDGGFYGVPLANFISWVIIAGMCSLAFPVGTSSLLVRRRAARLLQAMLMMFGLLGMKEGLVIPLVIAIIGAIVAEGMLRYDDSESKRTVQPLVRDL
ncbi:carotenoid biosynthesis protein [Paenibacillus chungangensis]|uniref:Carotenoid biosynthesis protein n=1 Tax=Paenibacillus chungangensis TaxID=696535 RepID=A0ABW3HLR8_9BACL